MLNMHMDLLHLHLSTDHNILPLEQMASQCQSFVLTSFSNNLSKIFKNIKCTFKHSINYLILTSTIHARKVSLINYIPETIQELVTNEVQVTSEGHKHNLGDARIKSPGEM